MLADIMPRMGLQRYPFERFQGLNLVVSPYDLDPGESGEMRNVRPVSLGDTNAIQKRWGLLNMNPGAVTNVGVISHLAQVPGSRLWGSGSTFNIYTADFSGNGFGDWVLQYTNPGPVKTPYLMRHAFDRMWAIPEPAGTAPPQKFSNLASNPPTAANWANPPSTNGVDDFVIWRGRGVVINQAVQKHRVYYSSVGDLEAPNPWNFVDIHDFASRSNNALLVHNDNLYLFKDDSLWLIYDPATFASRKLAARGAFFPDAVLSCPLDGRLYFYCPDDGHIHSSDGNAVGTVVETRNISPLLGEGVSNETNGMVFDAERGSVLLGLNGYKVIELNLSGKPGKHPIYYHEFPANPGMFTMGVFDTPVSSRSVLMIPSQVSTRIYNLFGTEGADDGAAINGFWTSAWNPFISTEPLERLRRLNFLYLGHPTIKVRSAPDAWAPWTNVGAVSYTPSDYVSANKMTREFDRFRPETRGRFHQIRIENNVLNEYFTVSGLEFAFRGGKEHQ